MDDPSYILNTQNTILLVWVGGGLAGAFLIILLVDSVRGQKNHRHHRRRNDEFSRYNPIVRIFKRISAAFRVLNHAFHHRHLQKAKHRGRHR
jgi:beta-lactamase regulating signal transducer with metallopeptidase domain